jgi:hypothetical protein
MIGIAHDIVYSDRSSDRRVWFGHFLVCVRNVPSARNKTGHGQLRKMTELSNRLQRMSTWNFWAAGLMGVGALLSVWARLL